MERRGFLAGLGAGAVGWLAGGQSLIGVRPKPVYAHPVTFIPAAEAASVHSAFVVNEAATALRQARIYQQSVASGDPNPNGAVIWTRVHTDTLAGGADGTIAWQVADAPDFGDGSIILEGMAAVLKANDHTVSLPLQNSVMQPFTSYYYRFIFDGIKSRVGRFKTLPAPGGAIERLKVGMVVCQDYSNGFYNAYGYLAQEDVDVVLFLGDYIYEYLNDGVGGPDNGPVRVVPPYPLGGQYPQGLADYRHLYRTYRADPQIQATHEQYAFISLWDDHEFFNDCHRDFHEDTNPPGVTATTPQPGLRREATKAWTEYSLAAVPYHPGRDFSHEITVYRTFRYGALLDLVVTDERLYRDGPPCGDVETERYETTGCPAQFNVDRSMLGATQRDWFVQQVTGSTATWKLWANEVMCCQYKVGPPAVPEPVYFDLDQWDGYPDERALILSAIQQAGVTNFVALSGDAHLFLASYLKVDFNDLKEAPMGVELMVGAVSSGNYLDAGVDHPGSAPASSPRAAVFAAEHDLPPDQLEPLVLYYNPHMTFWNGSTWGYGVLTITPEKLVCDFKVVSTVKTLGATLEQLATFTVPSGKVKLIRS